jgi:hypothetical protein
MPSYIVAAVGDETEPGSYRNAVRKGMSDSSEGHALWGMIGGCNECMYENTCSLPKIQMKFFAIGNEFWLPV